MIRLEGVGWTYAGQVEPALADLELQVRPGELVVLCGASGSGKSTALRVVNGLVRGGEEGTLTGRVTVAGLDPAATEPEQVGRRVGTVLQHPRRSFFTDRVISELAFASENFGVPPDRIAEQVSEAASLPGTPDLDAAVQTLSGGQQQLVAIAAATAHRPAVLLLDEPTANLASGAVEQVVGAIARAREAGAAVLVAEHRLDHVARLADTVLVLDEGRPAARWTAAQFSALDDDELRRWGLRPTQASQLGTLPRVPAQGASVRGLNRDRSLDVDPDRSLVVRDLRVRHGDQTVVALDHAALPAGAVTWVSGANAAGKTSLVRALAGLDQHSGTVSLHGRQRSRRQRRRSTVLVLQDTTRALLGRTVAEELGGAVAADQVLHALGLGGLHQRHPFSLSGGQQQRLSIAVASVSGREVVIADEPSSGVDRRHVASIAAQLRAQAARGAVVLLISHDPELVGAAADAELALQRPA